jgi:hypothetical protein
MLADVGVKVYSLYPQAQMGPLALLLATLPRMLYMLLVSGSVVIPLACVALSLGVHDPWSSRNQMKTAWLCGGLLAIPWSELAWKGHADDALVLCGGSVLLVSIQQRRALSALGAYALSLLGKPTAVVFAPLFLTFSPFMLLCSMGVLAGIWGPFLALDAGGLVHAGRGVMPVGRGSLPDYLGLSTDAPTPRWLRPAQGVAGLCASAWGSLRNCPLEGLALAFAVRALLDTNPAPAYSIPLVLLGILPDIRREFPSLTVLSFASWSISQWVLDGGSGIPRLLILSLLIAVTTRRISKGPR